MICYSKKGKIMKKAFVTRSFLAAIVTMVLLANAVIAQTNLTIVASQTIKKGDTFSAAINVGNVTNLAGYQMSVAFNPAVLQAVKVETGTFLATAGGSYCLDSVIDNTAGTITNIACIRTVKGGASGSGTLFTITFKANNVGGSFIKAQNARLSDQNAQVITSTATDSTVNVIAYPRWDVNQDGKVDILDLVIVGQRFGETVTTATIPNPDVNDDKKVDNSDLILIGSHFGETY